MALYSSASELRTAIMGWALEGFLPERHDNLMTALLQASAQAERLMGGRRLTLPTPTTLLKDAGSGAMEIRVGDVRAIDDGDVLVIDGENYRVLGADPTQLHRPGLRGRVYLASGLVSDQSATTPVDVRREDRFVTRLPKASPYGDALLPVLDWDRRICLANPPIRSVYAAWHVLPDSTAEVAVNIANVSIEPDEEQVRLAGTVSNQMETQWRIQYSGGYAAIPWDVREAVHLLVAARLVDRQNPTGSENVSQDDSHLKLPAKKFYDRAIEILQGYVVR